MEYFFSSNRCFKLWGYTVSHSSLILRSEMKYPDQHNFDEHTSFNIDFEFWSIKYIDFPSVINGLNIKEIKNTELPDRIDSKLLMYDMKIFEIESQGFKYYIIAGGVLIGKNKWGNQDRIFDYDSDLDHDEIIFNTN